MPRKLMSDIRTPRRATKQKKDVAYVSDELTQDDTQDESFEKESARVHPARVVSSKNNEFFTHIKSEKKRHAHPKNTRIIEKKSSTILAPSADEYEKDDTFEQKERQEVSPVVWQRPGKKKEHTNGQRAIWWVAFVAVIAFVIMFMNTFAGATITITPRQENAFIEGTFSAVRGGGDPTKLSFEIMNLAEEEVTQIPATEERQSERRASGRVVIYNAYDKADQRLVKKTRFEDPEGHIYRINESVVVPGMRVENGETVPGSIEVTVYADEPGEKYNIGLVDLTVPGFKGSPQYAKIYGRSKTPMTGGFIGTEKVASDEAIATAQTEAEKKLSDTLLIAARNQTPEGFILGEYGATFSYEHADPVPNENGKTVNLTSRGTLDIMIFDAGELARFVAKRAIASYGDESVYFSDPTQLSIGIVPNETQSTGEVIPPENEVTLTLGGTPHIVWTVDENAITTALLEGPTKRFDEIMKTFSAVSDAQASVHPFWKQTFPASPDNMNIVQMVNGKKKE